jgi:hypothetical protein
MNAWPRRTSPSGCSSAELPSKPPPSRKGGSTIVMFGSVPVAAAA